MKASLRKYIEESLIFLPLHRAQSGRRKQSIHLDQLLDESRSLEHLSHSSLDFILMTYRYWHAYLAAQKKFSKKALKPAEMQDLWALGFSALLTRDQTPPELIVNDCVELSKKLFGPHTSSITNAFLRQVSRDKEQIKEQLAAHPEQMLGTELQQRWPEKLCKSAGKKLLHRPTPGLQTFDAAATFSRLSREEFLKKISKEKIQAMGSGSWELIQWICSQVEDLEAKPIRVLDACAAPGGKTLGLFTLLKSKNLESQFMACDSKFPRMELLKKNIVRWDLSQKLSTELVDWTSKPNEIAKTVKDFKPHVVLVDLPCSGLGTLHSRPDLLVENFTTRMPEIFLLQNKILQTLLKLYPSEQSRFFVSICSIDPFEIGNISLSLKCNPSFSSFSDESDAEGLVAWRLGE